MNDETDREIYPNAPLRLVAFEVRFPLVPEFTRRDGPIAVYEALRDLVPIIGPPQASIEIHAGAPGASIAAGPLRMLDRRRMLSITTAPSAIVVETTDYTRFEEFREAIRRALEAGAGAAGIAGMERIGLRYIDEIRVPGVESPTDWRSYINPALLATVELNSEFRATMTQGYAEYRMAEREQTNLRFGAAVGRVVDPNGPLRLKSDESGPFFLIDIDSFWTAPEEEVPGFSGEGVLEICASLRRPVRALFEMSITEKLRDEVLRRRK